MKTCKLNHYHYDLDVVWERTAENKSASRLNVYATEEELAKLGAFKRVFPKPTNFDKFTQDDINLALSHINSESRHCLNGNCLGEVAKAFIPKEIVDLIRFRLVPANEVKLSPTLFE